MKRFVAAALGLTLGSATLQAQGRVVVTDLGPGASGRILQQALAASHRLVEPDSGWFVLKRGEQVGTTLIVVGRTAAVAGSVEGDVIVVGGDLFVRPGAHVSGRAVAIGGGVYPSSLAVIGNGSEAFRDNTFVVTRTAEGYELAYQSLREHASPPLLFPGVYGLRFPLYDRVNGASVPFGPAFSFLDGRGELDALATYRSDLGKIDPSVTGTVQLSRRSRTMFSGKRGTFSNDDWIWSNFVNSLSALFFGVDTRNYYRADRAQLTVHRLWEWTSSQIEPFVGGRVERAWSVGPSLDGQGGPWSLFGRKDSLRMSRPNPLIEDGSISSVLAGTTLQWEAQGVQLRARTSGESNISAPKNERFTQLTSDVDVNFLTFGEQEYALDVHWVTTSGDTPPAQRFVYLGGSGTLPFLKLLEQGGDELLLIDQRYSVPLVNIRVGILGVPTLLLRHRIGSAGLGRLPSFEQMVGVGVMLTIVRGEVVYDPSRKKARASVGFSFSR